MKINKNTTKENVAEKTKNVLYNGQIPYMQMESTDGSNVHNDCTDNKYWIDKISNNRK